MIEELLKQIATNLGGEVEELEILSDGSGLAVMNLPLPKDIGFIHPLKMDILMTLLCQ